MQSVNEHRPLRSPQVTPGAKATPVQHKGRSPGPSPSGTAMSPNTPDPRRLPAHGHLQSPVLSPDPAGLAPGASSGLPDLLRDLGQLVDNEEFADVVFTFRDRRLYANQVPSRAWERAMAQ